MHGRGWMPFENRQRISRRNSMGCRCVGLVGVFVIVIIIGLVCVDSGECDNDEVGSFTR